MKSYLELEEFGESCCSSSFSSFEVKFGSVFECPLEPLEWPLIPLLFALVADLEWFWAALEGDAGGVALEHTFLANGSGDLKGGECVWGLLRLKVLKK